MPFDRNFPGVDNVPKWSDWAVRMAGAYDLFGNGKTALKVAANRYLESMAAGFASEFNPMTSTFSTRGWVDFDQNKSILDANGNIQYNEVFGGTSNFGAYSATAARRGSAPRLQLGAERGDRARAEAAPRRVGRLLPPAMHAACA